MATLFEEGSQAVVEWFGGWTAGDEVTGTSTDARAEAEEVLATVAAARGWDGETITIADAYIEYAQDQTDDADDFWQTLAMEWPDASEWPVVDPAEPPEGWVELGDVWNSYAGQAAQVFAEATEIIEETIGQLWVPDFGALAKAIGVGAGVGFTVSLVTDLNSNLGIVLGGGLAGLWNWSTQKNGQ